MLEARAGRRQPSGWPMSRPRMAQSTVRLLIRTGRRRWARALAAHAPTVITSGIATRSAPDSSHGTLMSPLATRAIIHAMPRPIGTATTIAPSVRPPARHPATRAMAAGEAPNPHSRGMNNFNLTEDQIDDLVAFLITLQ